MFKLKKKIIKFYDEHYDEVTAALFGAAVGAAGVAILVVKELAYAKGRQVIGAEVLQGNPGTSVVVKAKDGSWVAFEDPENPNNLTSEDFEKAGYV